MTTLTMMLSLFLSLAAAAQSAPRATYEVPVERDLAPYAKYEIKEFGKAIKGDTLELSYQLPLELTGVPQTVTFTGKIVDGNEPYRLTGPNGTMKCGEGNKVLQMQSCRVKYHDVDVDLGEVGRVLRTQNLSSEAVDGKLRVAALFSARGGDIGGVIRYYGMMAVYGSAR